MQIQVGHGIRSHSLARLYPLMSQLITRPETKLRIKYQLRIDRVQINRVRPVATCVAVLGKSNSAQFYPTSIETCLSRRILVLHRDWLLDGQQVPH